MNRVKVRSRGRAAGLGASLGAVSTIAFGIGIPDAGATEVPVYHWNKKGGCVDYSLQAPEAGNCGFLEAANFAIWTILGSPARPWHVTLNEVCLSQYKHMNGALSGQGYTGFWIPTNGSVHRRCEQHGMAVFTMGAILDSQIFQLTQTSPPEGDTRKAFCARTNTVFGGVRKVCTGHNTYVSGTRLVQDQQTRDWVTNWHSGTPATVGMDRNISGYPYPSYWTNTYKELDSANGQGRGTFASYNGFSSRQKLDYVWGSGDVAHLRSSVSCNLLSPGVDPPFPGRFLSDHCVVSGAFDI